MKSLAPLACLTVGLAGLCWPTRSSDKTILILYGGMQGYLSPCGCTSPMSGGVRRAATIIRQLESSGPSEFLFAGGIVSQSGPQDELKLEAASEAARSLGASALEFSRDEAALGPGAMLEMDQLSGHRLVSASVAPSPRNDLSQSLTAGPFIVTSIAKDPKRVAEPLGEEALDSARALNHMLEEASAKGLVPVVLFDGDETEARSLAETYPQLRVIIYRSTTDPPATPIKVGDALLLTAGFHGKNVVSVAFSGGQFLDYNVFALDPDVKDDPAVSKIYARYLRRVQQDGLLAKLPRFPTARYAGSDACLNCHAKAYAVWRSSGHFHSLHDLALQGHKWDPDCVGCHVVGLSSEQGFKSDALTPRLANVGCESCHGPAGAHARFPHRARLGKAGKAACMTCHTLDNSPSFDFDAYWAKIKH